MFDSPIPFIHRKRELIESLEQLAKQHVAPTGNALRLVRFDMADMEKFYA